MFDDERITITCGKIFRKGILIATILSFLFIILKSFTFINFFSVETLFLNTGELCIFFVGIYILIVGEFNDQFGVMKKMKDTTVRNFNIILKNQNYF